MEHELRVGRVLPADGLGDERHRADPENLGQRHHDELDVPRRPDPRDRRVAQPSDEVEIDQIVEGLEHHPGGEGSRQPHEVPGDGALTEVAHGVEPEDRAGPARGRIPARGSSRSSYRKRAGSKAARSNELAWSVTSSAMARPVTAASVTPNIAWPVATQRLSQPGAG